MRVDVVVQPQPVRVSMKVPFWLELALQGRKIDAIKAVRDEVYNTDVDGTAKPLGLRAAKDLVESFVD